METDLDTLAALAEAATREQETTGVSWEDEWRVEEPDAIADYFMAVDPATVTSLIERVARAEALEARLAELEDKLETERESKDRWRLRAKSAQNELSDIRTTIGLNNVELWTEADSISVYRTRAEDAEAERDRLRSEADRFRALLNPPTTGSGSEEMSQSAVEDAARAREKMRRENEQLRPGE